MLSVLFMVYSADINSNIQNRFALACSCVSQTSLEETFASTDAVFSGRVHVLELQEYSAVADIEIYRVWKGDLDQIARVNTGTGECVYYFEQGQEYLVFASKVAPTIEEPELYITDICSRTSTLQAAESTIGALDAMLDRELDSIIISTDFQNQTYTLYGNATKGIQVKGLTIYPDYGISLALETVEKEEWIELSLPKKVVDNITGLEVTISDYSAARNIDRMTSNETHTTVAFAVPKEAYIIVIRATQVVPELGGTAIMVAATTIAGLVAWAKKFRTAY